jgi:hypothetical protein
MGGYKKKKKKKVVHPSMDGWGIGPSSTCTAFHSTLSTLLACNRIPLTTSFNNRLKVFL